MKLSMRRLGSGATPRPAARHALIHALAAVTVAFVWVWQGAAPKLVGPHADEVAMLLEAGVPATWVGVVSRVIGGAELAFGLAFLPLASRRWPWLLTIALMAAATVVVLVNSPGRAMAPFNPVTLNVLLAALSAIGLLSLREMPAGSRK